MHRPKPDCPAERAADSCVSHPSGGQPFGKGTLQATGITRAEPAATGHIVLLPSAHESASRSRYRLTDSLSDIWFPTPSQTHTAIDTQPPPNQLVLIMKLISSGGSGGKQRQEEMDGDEWLQCVWRWPWADDGGLGRRRWRGMNGFGMFGGGPGLMMYLGKRRWREMDGFSTFRGGLKIIVKILHNEIKPLG